MSRKLSELFYVDLVHGHETSAATNPTSTSVDVGAGYASVCFIVLPGSIDANARQDYNIQTSKDNGSPWKSTPTSQRLTARGDQDELDVRVG